MKKLKGNILIAIITLILGFVLSVQFRAVSQTVGDGVLPTQRAQQLSIELKRAQEARDLAEKQLDEVESRLQQLESNEADKSDYTDNLYNELLKYRTLAGYVDLVGPGIVLEIHDPPIIDQHGMRESIIDDIDLLLQTVSVLNSADAEAISINDQRYTAFTEIERAGDHIEINGVSIGPPIVIKAIGNPSTLESALAFKRGIVWTLQYYDYNVYLRQDKAVSIPKYRRLAEFRYAKPLEETPVR